MICVRGTLKVSEVDEVADAVDKDWTSRESHFGGSARFGCEPLRRAASIRTEQEERSQGFAIAVLDVGIGSPVP
jgi:hypothetical protein